MRLLFLTAEACPTFRADVAALFGKYLPRSGIYSDVVARRSEGCSAEVVWGGGKAILCDISGGKATDYVKALAHGVIELFRADRRRYDAIQVRDLPLLAAFGVVAARLKKLPFVYWMSYPMPEAQILRACERGLSAGLIRFVFPWIQGQVGRLLLYRFVLPAARHVFVQSEQMKLDMMERGVAAEKMTAVPMGVDFETLDALAVAPHDDPRLAGRRVIVHLGTLTRTRRIERLFEMLAEVRKEVAGALLVLVGDVEDVSHRKWLRAQAASSGVADDVLWTGWLPMEEGWRYVRAAELGLSPFPRGFLLDSASPTKVAEYLALGIPVVCNDNPDQRAIVEATGAGRCVPYTASDFARATIELLRLESCDRVAMSEAGHKYVREYRAYSRIARDVAEAYASHVLGDTHKLWLQNSAR